MGLYSCYIIVLIFSCWTHIINPHPHIPLPKPFAHNIPLPLPSSKKNHFFYHISCKSFKNVSYRLVILLMDPCSPPHLPPNHPCPNHPRPRSVLPPSISKMLYKDLWYFYWTHALPPSALTPFLILITNTSEEFIKCRLDNFSMSFILHCVNFSICENK